MTNGIQTELWLEGFVKRANELGITAREDIGQLLKIACRMSLMNDPAFQSGYKEVMEKQGIAGVDTNPGILNTLTGKAGPGDWLDYYSNRPNAEHPGTYDMRMAKNNPGWFQRMWRPQTIAHGEGGLAGMQGAATDPAYGKQMYADVEKQRETLQRQLSDLGGSGDMYQNRFRDPISMYSGGRGFL